MFKRQQVSSSLPYFILLQQGDLQWFEPSAHADHAHENEFVAAIHRLYAALEIDGKRYRVKLTVKEYTGATTGRNLHALAAVEIENAPPGTFPASADAAVQPDQPTTGRKISIANLLAGATRADGSAFVPE